MFALTPSSSFPLSPALLVSSSAPGSLSLACRPQFSDHNKNALQLEGEPSNSEPQDGLFSCVRLTDRPLCHQLQHAHVTHSGFL